MKREELGILRVTVTTVTAEVIDDSHQQGGMMVMKVDQGVESGDTTTNRSTMAQASVVEATTTKAVTVEISRAEKDLVKMGIESQITMISKDLMIRVRIQNLFLHIIRATTMLQQNLFMH